MTLKVGEIVEGKVKSIVPFGLFVELEGGKTALCHISEISNDYVKDIREFAHKDETLTFKVIESSGDKISLSRKDLFEEPAKAKEEPSDSELRDRSFEDKMSRYLKEANEKLQSINQRTSRKRNSSRSKR